MFKKPKSLKNIRKRTLGAEETAAAEEAEEDQPVLKVDRSGPGGKRARPDSAASENTGGSLLKEQAYEASGTAASLLPTDMGATATRDIDTAQDRDATAILERQIMIGDELEGLEEDRIYRGQSGYQQFFKKRDTAAGNATSSKIRVGPMRASGNIRITARFDYQPDICKDYKETGYCGYGDSCKFLHDRGDYKSGWEMDKEWEKQQKLDREAELKARDDEEPEEEEDELDGLPFACLICREPFTNPIVTKCGHYFCEKCAIKQHKKSPKCFACGVATLGAFSVAKELIAKLKEKQRRIDARLEEARALNTANLSGDEIE